MLQNEYKSFEEFKRFLEANDYVDIIQISNKRWGGLQKYLFNWAIVVGIIGDDTGYEDRWDLTDYFTASNALQEWTARNFDGEPDNWVRHLRSGRRRPDGTKESEEYRP
jgi:hypothetical protein